jgi:hypothetical protein
MAADNMVWNITPDGVKERMATLTDTAWAVPGPTRQAGPERGRRAVFGDFTNSGYWMPGYRAQDEALDKHMEKYNLQKQDWRPGLYKQIEQGQKK